MTIPHSFTITQPTQIHFGQGMINSLPRIISSFNGTIPLVVIDPGLEKAGIDSLITGILDKAGISCTVFNRVDPEPGLKLADLAAETARQNNCDCVVGAGGGSAMDIAKAASILLTNGGKAADYLGLGKIGKPGVPKIMVPTSAGTGAEVTFTAVFINEETGSKGGMNGDPLYPDAAILDPELTLSLPPGVTASTGLDALAHALEAYTSIKAHPISEMYSLEAIDLITGNIRAAYADGRNLEARTNMLMASLLGGKSLAMAGVGLVHAMAYPLGGMFGIAHGLANAVLLPYVTEYNLIGNLEKHAHLAAIFGFDTGGMPLREAAAMVADGLFQLNMDLNIPATLADINVPGDKIPEMADIALKVAVPIENNPRRPSRDDIIAIYEYALNG
ncbi:MAG: iron-containing alcohol dehydrogenase [Desulfobulbaceae bacterium]|nr:iron-containing alcohol dehydrogenase [Desulfobulbaceae bacterium]